MKKTRWGLGFLFLSVFFSLAANGAISCLGDVLNAPLAPEEIHYQVYGDDKAPPLVLIHGLGGSSRTFVNLVPWLAKKYRVVTFDMRGHGYTVQRGWEYTADVMARDLKVLFDHLKIDKAHILGLSFGARTGIQFAHLFPERVLSFLVEDMEFIARKVDYEEEYTQKAKLSEHLPRYFDSMGELAAALRPFYSRAEIEEALEFSTQVHDGKIELMQRPHSMFLFDLGANGVDFSEQLKNFKGPLLFVRADPLKSMMFAKGVQHVQRLRPDVPIITVAGADHIIHGSHPFPFLRIAERFFDSVRPK